jgi:hypothetical protein
LLIRITTAIAVAALFLAGEATADARGTATVTKRSGVVKTYDHVRIRMLSASSLRITSADGRGSLTIDHAACTFTGDLQRCLPYDISIDQNGARHQLDLERGTLYLNTSDAALPLPHSSAQVGPHSIMLALRTERGTLISITGRIDGELK